MPLSLIFVASQFLLSLFAHLNSRAATAFSGNDAIFKVRCSSGVEVESFLPMSQTPGVLVDDSVLSSPELELSTVTSDTCVAIQLRHKIGVETIVYVTFGVP